MKLMGGSAPDPHAPTPGPTPEGTPPVQTMATWTEPPYIPYGPGGPGPQNPAVTIQYAIYNLTNPQDYVAVPVDQCYCKNWYDFKGDDSEQSFATSMGYVIFITSCIIMCGNLALMAAKGKKYVAWQVPCVAMVIFSFYGFQIWLPFASPVLVFLSSGNYVVALRYCQWLIETPLLQCLTNDITGRHKSNDFHDLANIIWFNFGVTMFWLGSYSMNIYAKVFLYICATCPFFYVYWVSFVDLMILIRKESPTKFTKALAFMILIVYMLGNNLHALFATLGPEWAQVLRVVPYEISATFCDLTAKIIYLTLCTALRYMVAAYYDKNGEPDVDELIAPALLPPPMAEKALPAQPSKKSQLVRGTVILAVPDGSMADYFAELFEALPGPIELIPAMGADSALQMVQMAMRQGGPDCVLIHPQYLMDQSQNNLALRVKQLGQRVCAFDFDESMGPAAGWMLDGWLEGGDIDEKELEALVGRMQVLQRFHAIGGGSMHMPAHQQSFNDPMMQYGSMRNSGLINSPSMMGANPMYGSAPSPMGSGMGGGGGEADMMRQMMAEINRLKTELAE